MKLKKLFAGVVAAAMMLTMAVPAFAGGPIKSEDGITSYTLNKSYQLIGTRVRSKVAPSGNSNSILK